MKALYTLRRAAALVALVVLVGCSTMQEINQKSVEHYHATSAALDATLAARPSPSTPVVPIDSDLPYVNVVPVTHTSDLPPVFDQPASLRTASGPAWQTLQTLQGVIGLPIHADGDVMGVERAPGAAPAPVATSPLATDATLGALPPLPALNGLGSANGSQAQLPAIARQDTTRGLMNYVAGLLDATWTYDAGTHAIHIYRFESKVLHIAAVPGDASATTSVESGQMQQITGGQGQAVSASASPSKTAFSGKLDVWKSVADSVKPMLSPAGSLEVNQSTASITVRDRWDRVAQVEKYVDQVNHALRAQVEVNVKIYRIQQNHNDNRGINWSVLYNAVGQEARNFGVSVSTPRPTATGLSSLILNSPAQNPSGSASLFAGSQAFVDALSTLGNASRVEDATVLTTNNIPVPFKVIHSVAYVASATPNFTTGTSAGSSNIVGAGATLQQGTVQTGFEMQVLPSVQQDGHLLLLQTMLSVSTLDNMAVFTSGGSTVQQPNVSAREFLNRAWLKSGQSLVLAGFQDTESNNTTTSPLDKHLWGIGGNRAVSNTKDEIVVVITPVVTQAQTTLE